MLNRTSNASRVLFSVIVPTYNRRALLERCVESILCQKFSSLETIVVDDGSTDDTETIAHKYVDNRLRYFKVPHGERSKARNYGITKAVGDYICFVDDDDYLLDHHLQVFYEYLRDNAFPQRILRTGYFREIGKKRYKTENYNKNKHGNPVQYVAEYMCGVGSLCIPRNFLIEDLFPEQYWHFQDTHLYIRLLAKRPFDQINEYTYVYVIHKQMGSRFTRSDFKKRAENNLEAMENLFSLHKDEFEHLLPVEYMRKLIADKAVQHSSKAFSKGWINHGMYFFHKANENNTSIRNILNILRKLPGQLMQNVRL